MNELLSCTPHQQRVGGPTRSAWQ